MKNLDKKAYETKIIFYICILLIVVETLLPWHLTARLRPSEPFSVSILYRDTSGDIQYFPLIARLSRGLLTESSILEQQGTRMHSFPVVSLSIHACLFSILGNLGFIVAEVCVTLCYYLLLYFFLRVLHIGKRLSSIASLFFTLGIPFMLDLLIGPLQLRLIPVWGPRIPRPFISELFLLAALGCVSGMLVSEKFRAHKVNWFFLGVALAALLQSDIHVLFIIGMSLPVFAFLLFFMTPENKIALLPKAGLTFGTTALLSIPFMIQRMQEHPDIPGRWGVFPADRFCLMYTPEEISKCILPLLIFWMFWLVIRSAIENQTEVQNWFKILLYFSALVLIAYCAVPLSVIVLGKGIQLYHFRIRAEKIATYCSLAFILWGINLIWHRYKRLSNIAVIAILAMLAVYVWQHYPTKSKLYSGHLRPYLYGTFKDGYREEFSDLIRVLSDEDKQVLATFDHQVFAWWLTFTEGYSFLAEPFVSTVPDSEIERRLAILCKTLGMSAEEYLRFINLQYVNIFWLGLAKYQASKAYTFSTIDDYPPAMQWRIAARTTIYDNWTVAIPLSEQHRLMAAFKKCPSLPQSKLKLDIIVLHNDKTLNKFSPPQKNWNLVYLNKIFRVYKRRK